MRYFQTVCAVVPKVTTVLPVLLESSTHWLLTKQFTHVTAISRMASLQGRIEWQSFRTRLPYGYGSCTAWKLVGVIVSRCLCVFFFSGWPWFFLFFRGLLPTDCWLNISHMSQLFPEWLVYKRKESVTELLYNAALVFSSPMLPALWKHSGQNWLGCTSGWSFYCMPA